MTETITTKVELLAAIDREWLALQSALARISEEQMIVAKDAAGWTVKDHLTHLTAWERSVIYLLQGQPRHEGLGVHKDVYAAHDYEVINEVIQRQTADVTPQQAMEELQSVHEQLMALVQPMGEEELHRPYRHYLPEEADDDRPVIDVIYGNTAGHHGEHLVWMAALLARGLPM